MTDATADRDPLDELAEIEARKAELLANAKAANQPALEEAAAILADPVLKGQMERLSELGASLTREPSATNARMMLNSLTQSFGGAVNTVEAGLK